MTNQYLFVFRNIFLLLSHRLYLISLIKEENTQQFNLTKTSWHTWRYKKKGVGNLNYIFTLKAKSRINTVGYLFFILKHFHSTSHECGFCTEQAVVEIQYIWKEAFSLPENLQLFLLHFFSSSERFFILSRFRPITTGTLNHSTQSWRCTVHRPHSHRRYKSISAHVCTYLPYIFPTACKSVKLAPSSAE